METGPYLIEYYNRGFEDGRLASRHGSVEFLTHHALDIFRKECV